MTKHKSLDVDDLEWEAGTPIAPSFGDVYFSREDGQRETDYVFIDGVDFDRSIRAQQGLNDCFVIGETGFGTGLNFLQTWHRFQALQPNGRLYFISTEKYPLTASALKTAHDHFPSLKREATLLRECWSGALSAALPGFHLRHFDGDRVTLLLLIGDIHDTLPQLKASVDAWYLDGFAPAKNPDMWSAPLFDQLKRLSRSGTRLATFTAAGLVRRGLEDAGFSMHKTPGFGHKRERLVGTFSQGPIAKQSTPSSITLVGSGLAGSFLGYRLKKWGYQPEIVCAQKTQRASNVPAAILAPRLQLDTSPAAQFFEQSYDASLSHPVLASAAIGTKGITIKAKDEKDFERTQKLMEKYAATDWFHQTEQNTQYRSGAAYDTKNLCIKLCDDIPVTVVSVDSISHTADGWHLYDQGDAIIQKCETLVLCTGFTAQFGDQVSPMDIRPNKGTVMTLEDPDGLLPKGHYTYGGYLCDHSDGYKTLGSTFDRKTDRHAVPMTPNTVAFDEITAKAEKAFNTKIQQDKFSTPQYFTALRATTADHCPLVGPVPDWADWQDALAPLSVDASLDHRLPHNQARLFTLTGLGSKGLQYAPLCAEILASEITGAPCPVPIKVLDSLSPGRFLKRRIIRNKA